MQVLALSQGPAAPEPVICKVGLAAEQMQVKFSITTPVASGTGILSLNTLTIPVRLSGT